MKDFSAVLDGTAPEEALAYDSLHRKRTNLATNNLWSLHNTSLLDVHHFLSELDDFFCRDDDAVAYFNSQ